MDKKLSDEQLLALIQQFESLKDEEKASRLLGQGRDKVVYDVPGHNMVMKVPKVDPNYPDYPYTLHKEYLYGKQLKRELPNVETPILVKRPDKNDVMFQQKHTPMAKSVSPDYDNMSMDEIKDFQKQKMQDFKNHPYTQLAKEFDKKQIEGGDLHEGNVAFDKEGKTKLIDWDEFSHHFEGNLPDEQVNQKNSRLYKAREIFGDNMDKLAKTRVFRSIAGALPLAGTAMALSSGDANAAAEELPGEIPVLGQAYDAIRPETAGSAYDDRQMIAERNAAVNYSQSQARKDALKKMGGK